MASQIDSLKAEKVRKIERIRELGINPYPYSYAVDIKIVDIKKKYDKKLKAEDKTEDYVKIAGRIMLKRGMGKVLFMKLQDEDSSMVHL